LAGGEYVYLRESFGDLAAFLTGSTSFVAGFSGAIAACAVGVTVYPAIAGMAVIVGGLPFYWWARSTALSKAR
jgi:hypothetical protein